MNLKVFFFFFLFILFSFSQSFESYSLYQNISISGPGSSYFGYSVAISGDGSTIAITVPTVAGYVLIYSVNETTNLWETTAQIDYPFSEFANPPSFGSSLALSENGDVIAIGCDGDDIKGFVSAGSVYVFQRSSGIYHQVAQLINTHIGKNQNMGFAVAMSSDGSVISAGGYMSGSGCIFVNSGFGYSPSFCSRGITIYYNQEIFGIGTSVNSDGSVVAFISGGIEFYSPNSNGVYVLTNVVYNQAVTVALSSDGNTGCFGYGLGVLPVHGTGGASWMYKPSGSTTYTVMNTEGPKYFYHNAITTFGSDVAMTGDGSIMMVAEPPYNVYVISLNPPATNMTELQRIDRDSFGGEYGFGTSISLSTDGSILVVGSPPGDFPGAVSIIYKG